MSTSTIQLPVNFVADIITQATSFLGNLSGYLVLIIGIIVAVIVVEILIGALRK